MIQRWWWWCPERRVAFLLLRSTLVFNSFYRGFCRVGVLFFPFGGAKRTEKVLSLRLLWLFNDDDKVASTSSWERKNGFLGVHFFLTFFSFRKSWKSTRRWDFVFFDSGSVKSYSKFFGFAFRLLLAATNTSSRRSGTQTIRRPKAEFLSYYLLSCALNATRSSLSRSSVKFIISICRLQTYVTKRAFHAFHVYTFLIWFSSFASRATLRWWKIVECCRRLMMMTMTVFPSRSIFSLTESKC